MTKKLIFITTLIISLGLTALWLTGAATAGAPSTPLEGESLPAGSVPSSEMAPSQVHPVWTEFDISQHPGSAQTYPEIAADSDRGSHLVVWRDERDLGYKSRIYGRIISAAGEVFTETLIYSQTAEGNLVPWTDVAYHQKAGDRYLVVWNADDIQFPNIYGQVVAFNGTLMSDTFQIDGG
ncbi:MAG: hypothetical protein ABIG63_20520, partial [Chloroflexota bacterium]